MGTAPQMGCGGRLVGTRGIRSFESLRQVGLAYEPKSDIMQQEQAHFCASSLLNALFAQRRVHTDTGEWLELDSEISPAGGEMLQEIIRELQALTTLEIGLAYGVSALSAMHSAIAAVCGTL